MTPTVFDAENIFRDTFFTIKYLGFEPVLTHRHGWCFYLSERCYRPDDERGLIVEPSKLNYVSIGDVNSFRGYAAFCMEDVVSEYVAAMEL